jgi:flagellar motor protein MotB
MHVSMAGPKLSLGLGDIVLDDFYGNILLNNQAHLNVTDIMVSKGNAAGSITQDTQTRRSDTAKKGQAGPEEPKARAAKKSVARPEPRRTGGEPDISISSVRLERGRMTFNDHFVRPNYRAELSSIHGTLTAVSSVKPAPAKVSVTGRVYSTAPFSVSGTVQPFSRHLALDIKASAKGVDLPRFTTYSSKYVGYAIQRGKLTVDLQYQIKNRALQASNKVQLNQLTFGKPSNSPDALKLPVLLAVALLKDSNGNIDIDLPISGSLDDPQFSVGGIVVRVIMNTLVKVVSSPFKLLASAFGGSQEDLSYIDFAPGSAALDDKAKSSIETLAKALTDRPALKMDIIGHADPKSDETGLRQAWLDDQLRKAKGTASRGRTPDPKGVALTDADRAKYLEKVYRDTNIKGKPRNFVGMAKSQPPDQMKAMLLAVAPLGRQALHNLAEARAQAVYEQLQETAQNLTSRVFIVAPKLDAKDAKDGEATRVEFALH